MPSPLLLALGVIVVLLSTTTVNAEEGLGYARMVQDGFGFGADEPQFAAFRGSDYRHDTNYILVWHGNIFGADGYCEEGRAMIKALYSYGVPLVISAVDQLNKLEILSEGESSFFSHLVVDPVKLRRNNPTTTIVAINHAAPQNIKPLPWADITIIRTMWEVFPFPARGLALFEGNEVWVPSEFNKRTFKDAGYPKDKLYVVGQCADENYENFTSNTALRIPDTKAFNFVSVFNWNYRKGWDVLVQAFLEEFETREDVALILKMYSDKGVPFENHQDQMTKLLQDKFSLSVVPTSIVFINQAFKTAEMPLLYKSADAYVSATRGEGWGRGSMEAMLMNTPVITTRCTGQEEFINSKTAYPVPYKRVAIPEHGVAEFPQFKGLKWAEPDISSLRKQMRKVYESPREAKKKANYAREWYLERFSKYKIAKRMKDRVDELVSKYKS